MGRGPGGAGKKWEAEKKKKNPGCSSFCFVFFSPFFPASNFSVRESHVFNVAGWWGVNGGGTGVGGRGGGCKREKEGS